MIAWKHRILNFELRISAFRFRISNFKRQDQNKINRPCNHSRMFASLAVLAEPLLLRQRRFVHVEADHVETAEAGPIAGDHVRHAQGVQLPARRADPVVGAGRSTAPIARKRLRAIFIFVCRIFFLSNVRLFWCACVCACVRALQ